MHVGLLRTSVFMLTLLSGPIEFDMWITPHWNQYTINLVTLHHSRFPSAPFPLLPSGGINRFITPELEQMVGNSAGFFVVVFFSHLEHWSLPLRSFSSMYPYYITLLGKICFQNAHYYSLTVHCYCTYLITPGLLCTIIVPVSLRSDWTHTKPSLLWLVCWNDKNEAQLVT